MENMYSLNFEDVIEDLKQFRSETRRNKEKLLKQIYDMENSYIQLIDSYSFISAIEICLTKIINELVKLSKDNTIKFSVEKCIKDILVREKEIILLHNLNIDTKLSLINYLEEEIKIRLVQLIIDK